MSALDTVETVAIVMMENRSFDHMLGHLSLPEFGGWDEVDGLEGELDENGRLRNWDYMNPYATEPRFPFLFEDDRTLSGDVPHDRPQIQVQLGPPEPNGEYPMNGFVKSYQKYQQTTDARDELPMGFFGPEHVPITTFFAENYLVCDRWFCSLPASTQPNKLIALAGDTSIDVTERQVTDDLPLVTDWAEKHELSWRVYSNYVSLFMLFKGADFFEHPNFRPYGDLEDDIEELSAEEFPDLVIIEPDYQSVPHPSDMVPNDNHAPLPVRNGERFLKDVYDTLTADPEIWAGTVLVHTYDEHGGFWDHVSPPQVPYEPPEGADFDEPFKSLGPRVPGLVISPLVRSATVFHGCLDHTSVLQFIAEALGPDGAEFSPSVTARLENSGLQSLSNALNLSTPRSDIPDSPPAPDNPRCVEDLRREGFDVGSEPVEHAMRRRCEQLMAEREATMRDLWPGLFDWARDEKKREPYDG